MEKGGGTVNNSNIYYNLILNAVRITTKLTEKVTKELRGKSWLLMGESTQSLQKCKQNFLHFCNVPKNVPH